MKWPFPAPDKKRFEELRQKPPEVAISIWLQGEFTIGEEPALLEAIRDGLSLRLDDGEITEIICDCMDDDLSAPQCKERLFKASHLKA